MIRYCLPLAALTLALPALAQTPPPPAPPPGGGMTLDQFVGRQTERMMAADTDGDGRISRAELSAMATRGGQDPSRRFDVMDTDHDGYLDQGEIRAALTRRFQRMDRNGDGVVSPDERMAGRERRAAAAPPAQPMPPAPPTPQP